MNGRAIAVSIGLTLATACEGWPRWSDDLAPADDIAIGEDPRTLVEVSWETVDAGAEPQNDAPVALPRVAQLTRGNGQIFADTLSGIGERCGVPDRVVAWSDPETCGEASFPRYAGEEGCDYVFDVDVVIVEPAASGYLCVSGWLGASPPPYRIDVVTFGLPETCSVPDRILSDDDGEALGFGAYSERIEYGFPVEPRQRYAVMVAGWAEHDREAEVPYNLGVALIAPPPEGPGEVLCPQLPPFIAPDAGESE